MLLEKIYKEYPHASLPMELTGRPAISSKKAKRSAFDAPNPSGSFPGWFPHFQPGPSNLSSYPSWPTPNPTYGPFLPPYPPATYPNIPSGPPIDDDAPKSPKSEGQDFEYPTISDFFEDLMKTEGDRHYFTNYTEYFHDQGYYRIDQLADESLTVEHMVKIIGQLKDGTARIIKNRALEKVRQIRKGKGKK